MTTTQKLHTKKITELFFLIQARLTQSTNLADPCDQANLLHYSLETRRGAWSAAELPPNEPSMARMTTTQLLLLLSYPQNT